MNNILQGGSAVFSTWEGGMDRQMNGWMGVGRATSVSTQVILPGLRTHIDYVKLVFQLQKCVSLCRGYTSLQATVKTESWRSIPKWLRAQNLKLDCQDLNSKTIKSRFVGFYLIFYYCYLDKVSLCSSSWLGTQNCSASVPPPSHEITGMQHTQLNLVFFYFPHLNNGGGLMK